MRFSGIPQPVWWLVGGQNSVPFQALLAQYVKRTHTPNPALADLRDCSQVIASAADTIYSAAELISALTAVLKGASSHGWKQEVAVEKQIQTVSEVGSQSLIQ